VRVHGKVDERALAALARGVTVDGVAYGPIEAGLDARMGTNAWLTVALREGKNREVRKVMSHLGLVVTRLIRTAYGPFQLGSLPRGAAEEVNAKVLREQLGLDAPKRGREAAIEPEAPEAEAAKPARPPRARHAGPQTPRRGKG
jgi:23S rRNA pseudouridine2605 synthase